MKSANLTLCLLGKSRAGDFYKVKKDNKEYVVTKEKLIRAIRETPSKNRNCTVRKGNIVMKPGFGEMKLLEVNKPAEASESKHKVTVKVVNDKYKGPVYLVSKMEPVESNRNIFCNDAFFNTVVAGDYSFIKKHSWAISKIDKAKLEEQDPDRPSLFGIKLVSPFGVMSIIQLSTGCKTILNALYVREKMGNLPCVINSDECGDNAFIELCRVVRGANIKVHATVLRGYTTLTKVVPNVYFDGRLIDTPEELGAAISNYHE